MFRWSSNNLFQWHFRTLVHLVEFTLFAFRSSLAGMPRLRLPRPCEAFPIGTQLVQNLQVRGFWLFPQSHVSRAGCLQASCSRNSYSCLLMLRTLVLSLLFVSAVVHCSHSQHPRGLAREKTPFPSIY